MSAMMPQDPNAVAPPTAGAPQQGLAPPTASPAAGGDFLPAEEEAVAEEEAGAGEEQRPVGTVEDDIVHQNMVDPSEAELPTVEEQKQYDDFVNRAILLISDNRQPEGGGMSPADATLKLMNNNKITVPEAVGKAAASTTWLLHNAAKRAGQEYTADVLYHGNDELVAALYLLGNAAGIFKGVPPYKGKLPGAVENADPAAIAGEGADADSPEADATEEFMPAESAAPAPADGEGPDPNDPDLKDAYDFSPEEMKILEAAKLEAAKAFGDMLLESGQVTQEQRDEATKFWQQQIEKEVDAGEVGDDILDGVDLDAARARMTKK